MLVTDGILRARYHKSFEKESFLEAGPGLRIERGPVEHVARLQQGAPHPRRRVVFQLASLRGQPEHGQAVPRRQGNTRGEEHAAPVAEVSIANYVTGGGLAERAMKSPATTNSTTTMLLDAHEHCLSLYKMAHWL